MYKIVPEDLILTRKSHNCAGIAFSQGDSAGDSKLTEQTLSMILRATFHLYFERERPLIITRGGGPLPVINGSVPF